MKMFCPLRLRSHSTLSVLYTVLVLTGCFDASLPNQTIAETPKAVAINATQNLQSVVSPHAFLGAGAAEKANDVGGFQVVSSASVRRATDALRVCNAAKTSSSDLEVRLNGKLLDDTVPPEQCRQYSTPIGRGDMVSLKLGYSGPGGEVKALTGEVLDEPILFLIGTPVDDAACGEECKKKDRKASYLIHQFYARHDGLQTAQMGFMDAQIAAAHAELFLRGDSDVPIMKDGGIRHISPGTYNAIIRSSDKEVSESINVVQGECYVIVRSASGNFMMFPDARPRNLKSSSRLHVSAVSLISFLAVVVSLRLV